MLANQAAKKDRIESGNPCPNNRLGRPPLRHECLVACEESAASFCRAAFHGLQAIGRRRGRYKQTACRTTLCALAFFLRCRLSRTSGLALLPRQHVEPKM